VTSVAPSVGYYGKSTAVEIRGQGFRSDVVILLDGVVRDTTYVDASTLRVTVPPGTLGDRVDVGVRDVWGRTSTLADAFEYVDGSFHDVTASRMPANTATRHVGGTTMALADVDGDGDLDVVVGSESGSSGNRRTGILRNDGKGNFVDASFPTPPGNGDDWQAADLAIGDLDGDGDADLVLTTREAFVGASTYGYSYWSTGTTYYFYFYASFGPPLASTRVLLNDGKGSFTHAPKALPDPASARGVDVLQGAAIALGDLDSDGDLDLIITSDTRAAVSTYTSFTNSYSYSFTYSYVTMRFVVKTYFRTWSPTATSSKPATRMLLNDGSATFQDVSTARLPAPTQGDLLAGDAIVLGDVDGDGDRDLVLTGDGPSLRSSSAPEYVSGAKTRILANGGSGSFTNVTATFFPPPKSGDDRGGIALALGDVDGDGRQDLVLTTCAALVTSSQVRLPSTRLFLGGSSGFAEKSGALPAVRSDGQGETWRGTDVVLGPAGADGKPDIVLVDASPVLLRDPETGLFTLQASSTRILRNRGSGTFSDATAATMPTPGTDAWPGHSVLLGDLDGDGDEDLLVTTDLAALTGAGKRPTRQLEFR
jgi:hypothetical protein